MGFLVVVSCDYVGWCCFWVSDCVICGARGFLGGCLDLVVSGWVGWLAYLVGFPVLLGFLWFWYDMVFVLSGCFDCVSQCGFLV